MGTADEPSTASMEKAATDAVAAPIDSSQACDTRPRAKSSATWPKTFNHEEYLALNRGKERKDYLMRFGVRHGLSLPVPEINRPTPLQQKNSVKRLHSIVGWPKGLTQKEYFATKPGLERKNIMTQYRKAQTEKSSKHNVPPTFVWPKGMNQEEFLSKKPGRERMTYLAKYITTNNLNLKKLDVRSHVPIGYQSEPQRSPQCACYSSEACASCSRCIELHCSCGLTGRQRRAICHESRACSCQLVDPSTRCKLCYGCRRPHALSHCRCVLHQRLLWHKRHPDFPNELTEDEEQVVCSCFMLAHRHGGAAATRKRKAKALRNIERVRRIKRAAGFPSSDNLYRDQKVRRFIEDEGLESAYDDGVDDGEGSEVYSPRAETVIPRAMTRRMLDPEYNPASYHPLFRSEGSSLLEAIEPRNGRISRRGNAAFKSDAIQREICRGLTNYLFEIDRNETMPADDLVDYVVYMASIKSANVGELIGIFEDSAAVAASIVIEEYVKQLVEEAIVAEQSSNSLTKASVKAYTLLLLKGFNWHLLKQQDIVSSSRVTNSWLSKDQASLKDKVAAFILHELISTYPQCSFNNENLLEWIRNAIVIPSSVMTDCMSSKDMTMISKGSQRLNEEPLSATDVSKHSSPEVRLSVQTNAVHGNPSYKLKFAAALEDGHHIEASIGGLDSRATAKATILKLAHVLENQARRSKGAFQNSPKAPGPPPIPRSLPLPNANDPYSSMYEHVWGHFNAYKLQKWEASRDKYVSAPVSGMDT
ncbi:hypothetical protein CCR75_002718 [Bremia lactucae]|uniref:Uncharacterized protein n=1 Tax=Bremia lactucae TaxID=4779 RepID=A0A976IGV1_BRELC|nr:hypothetical protein CCR75_002718 [Bremia lactucae]